MHPSIYGGYFPKIGSSITELKFITGDLLFPTGPQELRQSFEIAKSCKENGRKIDLNLIIETFELIANRFKFHLNTFSWKVDSIPPNQVAKPDRTFNL
jgi:hypothetical protein